MFTKEQAKEGIQKLVEKYKHLEEMGDAQKLTEEETKKDFILPLFRLLNWDVENSKEVTAEEKISKGFVDYGFRLNDIAVFFVEAKKASLNLQREKFVNQAMDYAWYKATVWTILTNFKRIRVFNARVRESIRASQLFDLEIDQYLNEFDKIWLFSKESFETREIDKYAESHGKKSKEKPVEKQLFEDLNKWRQLLANEIKKNYSSKYTTEEIDEIIQLLLDRLILIRKIEDQGLESRKLEEIYHIWLSQSKKTLWTYLRRLFPELNEIYNSKIFLQHELDKIEISDWVLKQILAQLYESSDKTIRYNFSFIDSDVLGNIYEQYLGYLLKTTKKTGKENGLKRKKQGIYYTPRHIVNYIVKNTLFELTKNKNLDEVLEIKILDPACGSGSFLIRSFSELCNIVENEMKEGKKSKKIISFMKYNNRLSLSQKIYILTNCIFGVDLDEKAVEISQLNLLLKILEGENRETLSKIGERKKLLPFLDKNIKCGNSLIDDPKLSERAFKWEESFKEIMGKGGFDIIVGNPPYFKVFEKNPVNKTVDYQEIKSGMMNVSAVFINKSLKLFREGSYLGMIVPKMLAFTSSWKKIRNKLLKNFKILKVVDCKKAFEGVLLEQIIFILKKDTMNLDTNMVIVGNLNNQRIEETTKVPQSLFLKENSIFLEPNEIAYKIKERMEKSKISLGEISNIVLGLGIQGKKIFVEEKKESYEMVLRGNDIQRYFIRGSKFYDPENENIKKLENTIVKFRKPHIVVQRIVAHIKDHIKITAAFDERGLFSFNTVTNIFITNKKYPIEYVLALLNSNVVQYYTYKFIYNNAIRSMDFYKAYAEKIPLPTFKKNEQDNIAKLTRKLINMYGRVTSFGEKKTNERVKIEDEIIKTEKEINELFYKIYGLTKDEQEVIEDSLK